MKRSAVIGAVGLALVSMVVSATHASAATGVALVRIVDTSRWSRPSPDPGGLAFG